MREGANQGETALQLLAVQGELQPAGVDALRDGLRLGLVGEQVVAGFGRVDEEEL